MPFHHAQPRKDDTSGDSEPLDALSLNINSSDGSTPEVGDELRMLPMDTYDEETCFELLSAYVDNEVTSEERQLVEQWLQNESAIQRMYQQMLMLRQAIRTAPVPAPSALEVPTPPNWWERISSSKIRRTLVCTAAIALISSLNQLSTPEGRKHLQKAWQFIQTFPQKTLTELASTTTEVPAEFPHRR